MKIDIAEKGHSLVKEAFNPVEFVTEAGESLVVCMRGAGFEVKYGGEWFEMKERVIRSLDRNLTIKMRKGGD